MSRHLRYLRTAQDDIRTIARYIAMQAGSRDTGMNFANELHKRCVRVSELPGLLGTARLEISLDLRSTPFQAYTIFFRYTPDAVEVINVLHASRDTEAHFHR